MVRIKDGFMGQRIMVLPPWLPISCAKHRYESHNQICHKMGIEDSYYFSRLFTKTMGISPVEYRQRPK